MKKTKRMYSSAPNKRKHVTVTNCSGLLEQDTGYETGITYDQLAQNPNRHLWRKFKLEGTVIQIIEDTDAVQIRLAVNEDQGTMLIGQCDPALAGSGISENDKITICGTSLGVITYECSYGETITVPGVSIECIFKP